MTTTSSTFDAAIASRNMKLTRTTAKHVTHHLDQHHYLVVVPRQIGRWYGGAVASLSGAIIAASWGYGTGDWWYFVIGTSPLLGAFIGCMASAIAADQGHRIWLEYATMGDMVEETAEPLPRPEAAETVQPNFVETTRADGRHIIPVNYNFTRPQIAWLASVAVAGESFPARDRAFKDSGVWTNYTKTFTDVRDALTNCDALDENGCWTPEGVRMIRDTKARLNNV